MNQYIAYCGLNCEACEARLATIHHDHRVKTLYCDTLCPIRQCALGKEAETCAGCAEVQTCEKAAMILGNNQEARRNLGM
jgi:hypothetical protein